MRACVDGDLDVAEGLVGFDRRCCSSLMSTGNDHSSESVGGWVKLESPRRSRFLAL